jgi:hypothetical protein
VSLLAAAPLDDLPTLEKLLDIELFIALEVLPRASDNASIKDFVPHLKKLISQLPHKALTLLGKFAFPDKKRLLDTMLTCPDSATRKAVCQLIVHLMNTAISHNQFTLKISLSDPSSEKDLLSLILYFLE